MSDTVHGGGALKKTKRVFMASGTAKKGYAVCYNWDAVGVTAENDAFITTEFGRAMGTTMLYWADARRVMVEPPNVGNALHFAGVVAPESDNVAGPNWICIHEPGSVCDIYTLATVTNAAQRASMLTYSIALHSPAVAVASVGLSCNGTFQFAGLPGRGSAWALMDTDATGGDYIIAELQDGPQSGGVQCIGSLATLSALAAATDMQLITHGLIITSTALMSQTGGATISIPRATSAHFPGQHLIASLMQVTVANVLSWSSCLVPLLSAEAEAVGGLVTAVTSSVIPLANTGGKAEWVDFRWNGVSSWILGSSNITCVMT